LLRSCVFVAWLEWRILPPPEFLGGKICLPGCKTAQ
jgi:hypothetical protein